LNGIGQESLLRTIVIRREWRIVSEGRCKRGHKTWLALVHSRVGRIARMNSEVPESIGKRHHVRGHHVGHRQVGWRLSRSDGRDERSDSVSSCLLEF
jgi:hypothetical protein